MRKKRTDKSEIKQNTTALIDFVNINIALLIDLLQLNCKYRIFCESVSDYISPSDCILYFHQFLHVERNCSEKAFLSWERGCIRVSATQFPPLVEC